MTQKLKIRPSIFKRAARLIEKKVNVTACYTLLEVGSNYAEEMLFRKYYQKGHLRGESWFTSRRRRVNALKRMARIAEKMRDGE